MNIFKQIKNSVYGPEYYKNVVSNMRLRSSIKYLAKFSLLIVGLAVILAVVFIPKMSTWAQKGITSAVALYPQELEITINNGRASINQPEPYFIKSTDGKNLVVINTKEEPSLSKFREYSAFALLSATEIVALKDADSGQLQVMPIPREDVVITKAMVLQGQAWLVDALPWLFAIMIAFGAIFFFIGNFVGSLIIALVYGLAVWAMSGIFKWNLSYKKSYQVSIHAMTLTSVLSLVTFLHVLGFLDNFFFKLLLVMIIVYINLRELSTTLGAPIVVSVPEPMAEIEILEVKEIS